VKIKKERENRGEGCQCQTRWPLATRDATLRRKHQDDSNTVTKGGVCPLDDSIHAAQALTCVTHASLVFFLIIFVYIKLHKFPKTNLIIQKSLSANTKISLNISYKNSTFKGMQVILSFIKNEKDENDSECKL
jgi:hypothetical protein